MSFYQFCPEFWGMAALNGCPRRSWEAEAKTDPPYRRMRNSVLCSSICLSPACPLNPHSVISCPDPALFFPQDRHDGNSNGNPRLPHLSAVSQHLYSPAPPLSHSGTSDFQPPYFPPPYQPLPYSQSSDPYSHLGDPFSINPLHQPPPPPPSQQQASWPSRQSSQDPANLAHHARAGLVPHLPALESGSAGARRETYRRAELLLPHGHGLDASSLAENLGLHDMAHQMEEVQVKKSWVWGKVRNNAQLPLASHSLEWKLGIPSKGDPSFLAPRLEALPSPTKPEASGGGGGRGILK